MKITRTGTIKKYKANKMRMYLLLMLPGILYFIIIRYVPMAGLIIAFKDFSPFEGLHGIISGEWVGLHHFIKFTSSYFFWNVMWNTLLISFLKLLIGFPLTVILALLLNEIRHIRFKKTVQTISYMPYFISWVVVAGLLFELFSVQNGIINTIIVKLGGEPINFMAGGSYFRGIIIGSDIWKTIGWATIVILAAITSIEMEQYESAYLEGANRFQKLWYITLPSISEILVLIFILRIGKVLDAGFEQILVLYSPAVYGVSDIIDTYVYREGIINMNYSFATAVGLFKSVIALMLIISTNALAKRMNKEGIW